MIGFIKIVRPAWDKPEIRGAISEGIGLGIQRFHKTRMPEKFTQRGVAVYKLAERTKAHEARKRREKGHNKPNVFSGAGRRDILRHIEIRVLKTKAKATGKMRARFLNFSNGLGWHFEKHLGKKMRVRNQKRFPDHKAEMERVNVKDTAMIAEITRAHVTTFFNTKGRRKTVKV